MVAYRVSLPPPGQQRVEVPRPVCRRAGRVVVALALLAACTPDAVGAPHAGRPRTERHTTVNGTRDPRTVLLTEPQIRSIGWLH